MNGHIQLSISLKNVQEIVNAIYLLHSLLPKPPEITVRPATEHPSIPHEQYEKWEKEPTPYAVAEGDILKLKTAKFKPSGKIITEANPQGIPDFKPKPKMLPNDKIIENLMRGAPKHPNTPNWKQIDADIKKGKLKQKFRQNALKRKRDIHGHFLKEVKKK